MKKTALIVLFFIGLVFPKGALAATFSLSPAAATKAVGDTFTVDVVLDPLTDAVSAASALVDYDVSKLTAVSVTQGSLFLAAPLTNTIDTTLGQIRYDTGSLESSVTTRGVMATITFRAKAAGTANVTFVFDPSATTETSLVAAATGPTNLLSGVNNGVFTITGSSGGSTLPDTGAFEDTLMVFGGGFLFLTAGVILGRKYFYAK